MKKYTFIFAVCVTLALTACGSKSTTPETTDSLAAQVDTSAITAIDSTTSEIISDDGLKKPLVEEVK